MKFFVFLFATVFSSNSTGCPWHCWKENERGECTIDPSRYKLSCSADTIRLEVDSCAFLDVVQDDLSLNKMPTPTLNGASNSLRWTKCGFKIINGYYVADLGINQQCGIHTFEDTHHLMYANTLRVDLLHEATSVVKQLAMDVRCIFDKDQKLINHQISYGSQNLNLTKFPDNALHLIGFGDFQSMFSVNRYTSDIYDQIKTSASRINEMIYWGIEVSPTFPNDVVYIPTQCSIEDKDTGDSLKLTENGCPISDIETLLGFEFFNSTIGGSDNRLLKFGHRGFQFTGGSSSQNLALNCDISLCLRNDNSSVCATTTC